MERTVGGVGYGGGGELACRYFFRLLGVSVDIRFVKTVRRVRYASRGPRDGGSATGTEAQPGPSLGRLRSVSIT